MKKHQRGMKVFLALFLVLVLAAAASAEETVFQTLGEIENLVYGKEVAGGGLVSGSGRWKRTFSVENFPEACRRGSNHFSPF